MSLSAEKVKQFNEILEQLLIQISPMCGTTFHFKFKNIIKYNALLPIEQFLVHALQHKDKIQNKDETYFTIKNNTEKENSEKYLFNLIKLKEQALHNNDMVDDSKTEKVMNTILLLQEIYYSLDSDSKDCIWDIMKALLIVGEDYIRIKYS
jgi:hypothetical protein